MIKRTTGHPMVQITGRTAPKRSPISAQRGVSWVAMLIAIAVIAAATVAGVIYYKKFANSSAVGDSDQGAFEIIEASNRDFDGSPALALSFSHPLDARKNYDEFVQVFQMPKKLNEKDKKNKQQGGAANDASNRADTIAEDEGGNEGDEAFDDVERINPNNATSVSTAPEDLVTDGGTLVKGSWVVGDNPRLLFFPHVKPQVRYVIKIAKNLLSHADTTLAQEAAYSVTTAAVSPAFYFASKGVVLPAKQNGGLPVVTVNIPEVDIQFLKVKSDQLPRFLDLVTSPSAKAKAEAKESAGVVDDAEDQNDPYRYDYNRRQSFKGAVSSWDLDTVHKLTESVYSGRFVTEAKQNRRSTTFIPVEDIKELKTPGIYMAVMSQPNRFRYDYQVTYFYVSDLGLHTRIFAKTADAFVSSLVDGKGKSGVEVSWLDEAGKVIAKAETDGDGRAHFTERAKNAKVVMAKQGDQISLIALKEPSLDLSEFDITGFPGRPIRLFPYAGRNLYRPGENFDISVLARDADGFPITAQAVQAILKRPDGKAQFTATLNPDPKHAGYYRRNISIPTDAPTGSWLLELRADPADKIATSTFKFGVEEFLPERLKLDLINTKKYLNSQSSFDIAVKGSYLYGAPAAGNDLSSVVQFERYKKSLEQKGAGFEFGATSEDSERKKRDLGNQQLNETGEIKTIIDVSNLADYDSPFTARAVFSLLESGGRPIVRSMEKVFWPASHLTAVRPLFIGDYARENSLAEFEVIRATPEGILAEATNLPARLFRMDRHYYWQFSDTGGWHSGFSESEELVTTTSVSIAASGRAKLSVPVKYGHYRLEILDPSTEKSLKYQFYAGWFAKEDESQGVRPDRVALKFDKKAYQNGDTASLTLTSPHAGEALITVEGDQVLWTKRQSVSDHAETIDIPVKKEWKRHDLYVSVMVMRPGSAGDKVTPARALGVLYLPLERDDRKLQVTLETPPKILPETTMQVKVKVPQSKGQAAMVTISAVDVGILNISRFASPDPHGHFFGQLRYGADQYDIYGRLIEKSAGQKGKLKFGGDSNVPKTTKSLPKKVKLVDLFSGPVALDAQGEALVSLPVPDFNGSLRVMAVVNSADKFGAADKEVVVASPLIAELSTPRFLTLGDNATIALDLHNLSGSAQKLKVVVSNAAGIVIESPERMVDLKDQQKTTLRFAVAAGKSVGLSNVTVKVTGSTINLERHFGLQVQAPTPLQQISRRYVVEANSTLELKDPELSGLLRNDSDAHLLISDQQPIDVRSVIKGLLVYPYGCVEQTTSTAYPHVFIDEAAAKSFGLAPFSRARRAEALESAIARLGALQAPNGGFSLWGSGTNYEYWLSAYVANFLADAKEQGFTPPEQMRQKAIDFLLKGLQEGVSGLPAKRPRYDEQSIWRDYHYGGGGRFSVLAYGAYVLALDSKAPLSTLRQLYALREQAHSGLALVHLGIALRLMGDDARAKVALAEGVQKTREAGYWWGDYGSAVRDSALSYYLLGKHKINIEGRNNLVASIADELKTPSYYYYSSTQEKLALFLVGRELKTEASGLAWSVDLNNSAGKTTSIDGKGSAIQSIDTGDLARGLKLVNHHKDKLFIELVLSGYPEKLPPDKKDEFFLNREIYDAKGANVGQRSLNVGESVIVKLTVSARRFIGNGMVIDRIPAGLEIENSNLVQGEGLASQDIGGVQVASAMSDPRIQHVEFRDDRFVVAARLGGVMNFFYRARVVTPGKFVMPPLYAEDMYHPNVYGLQSFGQSLTVVDARSSAKDTSVPISPPAQPSADPASISASIPTATSASQTVESKSTN